MWFRLLTPSPPENSVAERFRGSTITPSTRSRPLRPGCEGPTRAAMLRQRRAEGRQAPGNRERCNQGSESRVLHLPHLPADTAVPGGHRLFRRACRRSCESHSAGTGPGRSRSRRVSPQNIPSLSKRVARPARGGQGGRARYPPRCTTGAAGHRSGPGLPPPAMPSLLPARGPAR